MKPTTDQARFWQWFENNSNRLLAEVYGDDLQAREAGMSELNEASEEAAPGLVLEMCHGGDDGEAHELIVSVDGNPELVDAAKDFVDAAPALAGWSVVAFRPRGGLFEIALEGQRLGEDDVWFRINESSPDGLDLILYVRGLTKANNEPRSLAAFLLAEHAVGERDMLTLLNSGTAEPLPAAPGSEGLRPLSELVEVFDRVKAKRYPPPGKLPLGWEESEWAGVKGTKDGCPLLGILHLGLRAVAGHPDYDRRLIVGIPFHESNDDGFAATQEEFLAVRDLEERLTEVLQEGQQSLLALSIMAAGRREVIFHTADAEGALQRLENFRAEGVSHDLEPEVERDTFWGLYRSFCESPGSDEAEAD